MNCQHASNLPEQIGRLFSDALDADSWINSPSGRGCMKTAWMADTGFLVWIGDPRPDFPHEITWKDLTDMAEAILLKLGREGE